MTTTTKYSVLSTFDYEVEVTAKTLAGDDYDPTGDVVAFAFIPAGRGTPPRPNAETVWQAGAWVDPEGAQHVARVVVGPEGSVHLDVGTYGVWVKIVDNPEVPVLFVGLVELG